MLCCRPIPEPKEDTPLIVDLRDVLCDKAWNCFLSTLTSYQRWSIKRENYLFDVPENFYTFENVSTDLELSPDYTPVKVKPNPEEGHVTPVMKGNRSLKNDLSKPEIVSLETVFGNDTSEKQTYKFRFEKNRKTVISVSFHRGFTFGGAARFNVGIPKQLGFGLETDMHYQVTKTEGQTFEETVIMEATSDISVAPHSCCTANIQLQDKPLHTDFKVVMRMSIPQGRAPLYIRRKADGKMAFIYVVKSLRNAFDASSVPCSQDVVEQDGGVSHTKLDFVVEGTLNGVLACNHKILLSSDSAKQNT
ncbi:uncharacterized protein LOC131949579 [Physella acuta]|uniref:uncharacterized protein LOC131949579 n=1 Tax=Physella acuta TaxID=109671 RepID=UPI0027DE9563|nr:uncharacterized protein LOC131949579 [Physella acuta]